MCECLDLFSRPTREWFNHAFGRPTEVQSLAWPAIHQGGNVLVVAPTGSGKTLAAFLSAIDRLLGEATSRSSSSGGESQGKRRTSGVRILYISPLKALGVDVAKNLNKPLTGIAGQCEALGFEIPDIRVAIRSGDTTAKERRAIVSHPPDILVTTPESLYLMLTSQARRILSTVETVIIDEIHAMAGGKRGAHLAVSLERLESFAGHPIQRIGLSATVHPAAEAARFLAGDRPVRVINPGTHPAMRIDIVEPVKHMRDLQSANVKQRSGGRGDMRADMPHITGVTPAMQRAAHRRQSSNEDSSAIVGAAADGMPSSSWPLVESDILNQILAHRTTLVFVDSRGLAEKLTAKLNDLYEQRCGEGLCGNQENNPQHYESASGPTTSRVRSHDRDKTIAMAHHGSVSKDRRKYIEDALKQGRLRCVVATSSLELGIDMGSVDLVIQVAPPLSVSSGLQRVGRADHHVGGISHALIYPLTRCDIIGAAASVEGMYSGTIEPLHMPSCPLDVLAQQTVAAAALDNLDADAWYALIRRSAPFDSLDRSIFNRVIDMLTGFYDDEEFSAFKPPLMWNEEDGIISARPGAQRLAVTSGGTIPDRGMYTVVLPEADAGSGPRRVGELDEEMVYESRVGDIITLGTSTWQIQQITRDRVVVVPAPGRSARLPFWHGESSGRDYGFGCLTGLFVREISAGLDGKQFNANTLQRLTDDGLDTNAIDNLSALLSEQRACTTVIPDDRHIVIERCPGEEGDWRIIIHTPFGRRVHEPWAMAINARLEQRYGFGGQVYAADSGIVMRLPEGDCDIALHDMMVFEPDELRRIIEEQVGETVLFAARFREIAARSLFMPRMNPGKRVPLWQQRLRAAQLLSAARTKRDFPLILETTRECLQDVYDLPALNDIMHGLAAGIIHLTERTTQIPSPFAQSLLFAYMGELIYQYDVPQAERKAHMLSVDPQVLEKLLGVTDLSNVLDPQVIEEVSKEVGEQEFWNELAADDISGRVSRYAKTHGPFTADQMIADLDIDAVQAVHVLDDMKRHGDLLYGSFLASHNDSHFAHSNAQWLHNDVFRRIRARSLAAIRKAIKPVSMPEYQKYLIRKQGIGPTGGESYDGSQGVMRVVEQLEGIYLPLAVWEQSIFPARVRDYSPMMMDELLSAGDVIWIGRKDGGKTAASGRITFHPADSMLINGMETAGAEADTMQAGEETGITAVSAPEDAIMAVLAQGGAFPAWQLSELSCSFFNSHAELRVDQDTGEILYPAWSESQFEQSLWNLVWQGKVTNSSLAAVRAMEHPVKPARSSSHAIRPLARRRTHIRKPVSVTMSGLWSVVSAVSVKSEQETAASSTSQAMAYAEVLLDRYGIVAPPLVDMHVVPGGFSSIYPVLVGMEERGTLVRGMFVEGLSAMQFAYRETVDALRDDTDKRGSSAIMMDSIDPANLTGVVADWPDRNTDYAKPMRKAGNVVVLVDGRPVLYVAPRSRRITAFVENEKILGSACRELAYALSRQRQGSVTFTHMNGISLTQRSPYMRILHAAGFVSCPQGMKLY